MRILFYCDTVFSFGGVQRVLAEIAKALSGKHEVTILTTDTCTDLSMYGYAESTVRFDSFSYSASSFIERLLCKGYSFLYKNRHKAQRNAKFYINKCRSASCMQGGLKQASA